MNNCIICDDTLHDESKGYFLCVDCEHDHQVNINENPEFKTIKESDQN